MYKKVENIHLSKRVFVFILQYSRTFFIKLFTCAANHLPIDFIGIMNEKFFFSFKIHVFV